MVATLASLALLLKCPSLLAAAADLPRSKPDLTLLMPVWNHFYNLTAGVGYKDNILLASRAREASSFASIAGDFTLWKRPAEDGHELQLGVSANDRQYLANRTMDHEHVFVGHARYLGRLSDRWQWVADFDAAYFDQILDVTILETQIDRQRLKQFSIGGGPGLRYQVGNRSWLELTPIVSRSWLEGQFDSYNELGGQLSFLQSYGSRSEWRLEFAGKRRDYDTRRQATLQGFAQPGTSLHYRRENLQWVNRHYFDAARRWRLETRIKGFVSSDNGSGYYDYWSTGFSERLELKLQRWEFRLEAGYTFYHFPSQIVGSPTSTIERTRGDLTGLIRIDRIINRNWRIFGEFNHDRALAADPLETFSANTVWLGVSWDY